MVDAAVVDAAATVVDAACERVVEATVVVWVVRAVEVGCALLVVGADSLVAEVTTTSPEIAMSTCPTVPSAVAQFALLAGLGQL